MRKIILTALLSVFGIFLFLVILGLYVEQSGLDNSDYDSFDRTSYDSALKDIAKSLFSIAPLLGANKFEEARSALLNANLKTSEIDAILITSQDSEDVKKLKKDVQAMKSLLQGYSDLIDVVELKYKNKDIFVLDIYRKILGRLESARNYFTESYNLAISIDIYDPSTLSDIKETIEDIDRQLEELTKPDFIELTYKNTYISKIDLESVRDLAIDLIKKECVNLFGYECTTDGERAEVLYNFVRDNHIWVGDPSKFDVKEADYVQSPTVTLKRGAGDCDDQAVLLNSLLESVGVPSGFCFGNTEGKTPFSIMNSDHAFSAVIIDGKRIFADPVCKNSQLGENCFPKMEKVHECFTVSEFRKAISELNE